MGEALIVGKNLTNINCSWMNIVPSRLSVEKIVYGILRTYLKHVDIHASSTFTWEDHYKLRQIQLDHAAFDIGSQIGRGSLPAEEPEIFRTSDIKGREVMFRYTRLAEQEYHWGKPFQYANDPDQEWAEKLEL